MRKFDFAIQTLLFAFALLSGIYALLYEKGMFIFILLVQFFMGIWQLLSAMATVANTTHGNPRRTKHIRMYWLMVAVYFGVLGLLFLITGHAAIFWLHSAWLIAIYYYVLTIRLTFPQQRKTFMDAVN